MKEALSPVERKKILEQINNAEDEYLLLISKMRLEIPEVANLVSPLPCSLLQVQNHLIDKNFAPPDKAPRFSGGSLCRLVSEGALSLKIRFCWGKTAPSGTLTLR